ncbi:hypothetical protein ABEP44_12565, partial [Cutibacterium acnes]
VLDMEKEEWTDIIPSTLNMHFTQFDGDIVYFPNVTQEAGVAGLFTYNPETKEIKQIDGIKLPIGAVVNPRVVQLKDQTSYPGKTIVAGADSRGLLLINLDNKKVEYLKEEMISNATTLRDVKAGIGNDLILSSYMGDKAVVYDVEKKAIRITFPSLQIEGINVINNLYYCGMYGSGRLQVFDPSKPVKANENPKYVANM